MSNCVAQEFAESPLSGFRIRDKGIPVGRAGHLVWYRSAKTAVMGCLLLLFALCCASIYGSFVTESINHSFRQIGASYSTNAEGVSRENHEQYSRSGAFLFELTNVFGRHFERVSICAGNASDRQLRFLSHLGTINALEIRSDSATDTTLRNISELSGLKRLTVIGKRFTVSGLLALRHASELKSLRIDTSRLKPIELAVLRTELSGVKILSETTPEHRLQAVHFCLE